MRFFTISSLALSSLLLFTRAHPGPAAVPPPELIGPLPDPDLISTPLDNILATLPESTTPEELAAIFNTYSSGNATTSSPHLSKRGQDLFCETSSHSPRVEHVHAAANALIGKYKNFPGSVCKNTNPIGSKCTFYMNAGTAALAICSGGRPKGVKCSSMAWAAKHLANNCQNKDRLKKAGGYYEFWDAGVRVVVYRENGHQWG